VTQSIPPDGPGPSFTERIAVWGLTFVVLAACAPRFLDYLRPPTGDEVFYLITAQSIVHDRDLDETNQFADKAWLEYYPTCAESRAQDWKGFHPPGIPCSPDSRLEPDTTHTLRRGTFTKHGLGLSFLIAPAYALGGRRAVVWLLNGCTALLALNIFLLAWDAAGQRRIAWYCWGALSFTAPVFSYAFLIFPQLVGALCVLYAFRRARCAAVARLYGTPSHAFAAPANSALQMAGVALCLGFLPWLHSLYIVVVVPLLGYLFGGGRRPVHGFLSHDGRTPSATSFGGQIAFVLIVLALGTLYAAWQTYLHGVPWPPATDHHGFNGPLLVPVGLLGLFFDQKYGLLLYNPMYLIPIAWLFRLAAARRRIDSMWDTELIWLLAIMGPYYLLVADYSRWWGEWCPPARYMLPIAPLLTLPLARALAHARSRLLTWYARGALAWAAALSLAFLLNPILSYNWEGPRPCALLLWFEDHYALFRTVALGNFFPSYVNFTELPSLSYPVQAAWLALSVWLGARMTRGAPPAHQSAARARIEVG